MFLTSERHLRRLDGKLATVGVDVPLEIEVLGDTIPVENPLFDMLHRKGDDPEREAFRREIDGLLRRVRSALARSEEGTEAERLLHAGRVLRKVLTVLDSVDDVGPRGDREDVKRWLEFVKRVRHD